MDPSEEHTRRDDTSSSGTPSWGWLSDTRLSDTRLSDTEGMQARYPSTAAPSQTSNSYDTSKEKASLSSAASLDSTLHQSPHPGFDRVLRVPDLIEVLRPGGANLTFNEGTFTNALQDELDFFSPSLVVQGNYHDNPESKIYTALTKEMNRLNKNECRKLAHYLTSLVELQTIHTESSDYTLALRTTPPSQAEEGFLGAGFHLDVRTKRLLSTLVGPGMEWVLPEEVDPEQLALIMKGKESSHLFRDDAVIKQTQTGDVILFTGSRLPHRPPITTQRRLLCVIDSP